MTPISLKNPSKAQEDDPTHRARAIASTFRGEDEQHGQDKPEQKDSKNCRTGIRSSSHSRSDSRSKSRSRSPSFSSFRLGSPLRSPSNLKALKSKSPSQKRPSPNREADEPRRVSRRTDSIPTPQGFHSSDSPAETIVEVAESASEPTEHEKDKFAVEHRHEFDSGDEGARESKHFEGGLKRRREEKAQDEIIVPSEAVRFIIGKHGESIKAMTAASGAYVSMDKSFPGPSRKFDITGCPSQVNHCRELIMKKLEEVREMCYERRSSTGLQIPRKPPSQPSRSSEPVEEFYEMWIPQHKIGIVIGTGGATIRSINEKSGAYVTVRNERVDGDRKLLLIRGPVPCIEIARVMIAGIIDGPLDGPPRQSRLEEYPHRDYDMEDRHGYLREDRSYETKSMYVARAAVRHVIGKCGSMIKQLQNESGAKIRVASDEETGNKPERLITISGTPRIIENAEHMILQN